MTQVRTRKGGCPEFPEVSGFLGMLVDRGICARYQARRSYEQDFRVKVWLHLFMR